MINPECKKCLGTGHYNNTPIGTPHMVPCDLCCDHDQGRWLLEEHYGDDNGKWCCLAGCGKKWETEHGEH